MCRNPRLIRSSPTPPPRASRFLREFLEIIYEDTEPLLESVPPRHRCHASRAYRRSRCLEHDIVIGRLEVRRARELDPLSPVINMTYGMFLILARRYDEAQAQLQRAVELDPELELTWKQLVWAYLLDSKFSEAAGGAGIFHPAMRPRIGPSRSESVRHKPQTPQFIALQTVIAGRFSLEREIGRGGSAVVYLARDVTLNRPVAIKLLNPDVAADQTIRQHFLREARTAGLLSQPNIVPIHAVEEHGDIVFFVMGYVEGETLRQSIMRRGTLEIGEATRMLREVAWALGYAHARGITHRDVKPDHVMIERDGGRAIVTDFGIARHVDDLPATSRVALFHFSCFVFFSC